MVVAVELSRSGFARFDSYLLFTDKLQWLKLLINYILYFLPFFLGALALGIVFTKYVQEIGRIYFYNLAGSGIGALVAAALAWYFFPAALPSVTGLMAMIAGLFILQKKKRSLLIIALTIPIAAFMVFTINNSGRYPIIGI